MADTPITRRDFLIRTGILGAVVALYGAAGPGVIPAWAQSPDDLAEVIATLRTTLEELARDTYSGLVAFVVPGPDEYSVAQGVTTSKPGGIAANVVDFMLASVDDFVPIPDRNTNAIGFALSEGLRTSPVPVPAELAGIPFTVTTQLDDAVRAFTENDQVLPLSLVFALALNQAAVAVNPAAVSGAFLSPFARLTYAEKLQAMEMIESANADLVATIDGALPEPQTESVSGILRFVGGALHEFVGFGMYSEYSAFDPATRKLKGRPVGWAVTGYQPNGAVEGWDEFKGYFQGRKEASG
jgi:hypothetical protein